MNQRNQITAILLAVVILCSVLIIGGVWGVYIADHAGPLATDASTSSSQTESEESTTKTPSTSDQPKKMIALTFDDGPSGAYTREILDLLEQYQAKATFFVCGYQLTSGKKDILQRAISLGCEIGNHTLSHEYLTELDEDAIVNEILSNNQKISEYSGIDYQSVIYRPPGGYINRDVMEALYENGIRMYCVMWNSDSLDWSFRSKYSKGEITREEAVQGAFDTVVSEVSEGSVVLMHDIQSITPDLLKCILEKYTAEGYTFVTVSELFDFQNRQDEESYFKKYYSSNRISSVS